MTERCKYPDCPDDQPELFSWAISDYCSWDCQWKHRRALTAEAVARIDEVIVDAPETVSSSTLPAEPDPSGVRVPITPSNSPAVVSAMWGASDDGMLPTCHYGPHPDAGPAGPKTFGITHPAGVIPPEVERAVTEQIEQRFRAAHTSPPALRPDPSVSYEDVVDLISRYGRQPPEPIELTSWQMEFLKAYFRGPVDRGIEVAGGQIGAFAGVPVKIVDPTPRPGWLARVFKRVFG